MFTGEYRASNRRQQLVIHCWQLLIKLSSIFYFSLHKKVQLVALHGTQPPTIRDQPHTLNVIESSENRRHCDRQ